jgi:hypothetical protein
MCSRDIIVPGIDATSGLLVTPPLAGAPASSGGSQNIYQASIIAIDTISGHTVYTSEITVTKYHVTNTAVCRNLGFREQLRGRGLTGTSS